MGGFLTHLADKLAEKWLSLLVLPGLLFLAAASCARLLHHGAPFDHRPLTAALRHAGPRLHEPASAVLALAGVLLAAAAAGLAARCLAALVQRMWTGPWPAWAAPPARVITRSRRNRAARSPEPPPVTRYLPDRPTWIADRLRLVDDRVHAEYGLRVALLWPRLWLALPPEQRAPVDAARTAFAEAAALTAWGLLYLPLGLAWWPAGLAGLVAAAAGVRQGRAGAAAFADLAEAAVDVNQQLIAGLFGLTLRDGRITPDDGARVNDCLNKGA
ncbi:hypothetical protein Q3V23_31605 [Streptomyces sp. VNUA116]|uniref:hypothetical protein n=1 Tax=Streptomyces sp. VNUA116 TaxID=3062449 RepID=UPI0026750D32|nr:hypothetical protein [Streptomyces sp. VNUA116]WKU48245.1 hypothetical protein Q3V23_31605 [Streptomyces sp. VNUA116]